MTLDMSFESYMAKENGNRAIVLEALAETLLLIEYQMVIVSVNPSYPWFTPVLEIYVCNKNTSMAFKFNSDFQDAFFMDNNPVTTLFQASGLPAANVFIGSYQPPPAQPPIVPNSKWASNFPGFSIALDIHSFYQLSKPTYTAYTTAFIAGLTTALVNSNAAYSFKIQTEPHCASPSTAGGTRIFFNILTDLQTYDAATPVLGDVWRLFGCTTTCAAGTAAGDSSALVTTLQSYGLPITNAYYIDQLA